MEATPLSWKGGVFALTIPPKHAYLKKRLEAEKNRKYIENILEELLGSPATLRVILQEPAAGAPAKPVESDPIMAGKAPPSNSAPPTATAAGTVPSAEATPSAAPDDTFLPQVLDLFQGRLIEAGGSSEVRGEAPLSSGDFWADGESIPAPPDEDEEE